MKTFKDYFKEAQNKKLEEIFVFYHFKTDDVAARFILSQMLNEERKHVDLGKGREIFFHKAHVDPGQDHLHFYQNGAKLYSINMDGTAHDKSHGKSMAKWAKNGVKDHFNGFTLPKNGLIEALLAEKDTPMLVEGAAAPDPVLVTPTLLSEALAEAWSA